MVIIIFQKPIRQVHTNQQFPTTTKLPFHVNYDYGSEETTQSLQGNTLPKSHCLGAMYQQHYLTRAEHLQMAKIRGYFLLFALIAPLILETFVIFKHVTNQTKQAPA